MKKQILSILGLILLSINTLFAYSFFNVSNGDTIYYNIKSTNTVEVTKKNYTTPYSGNIVIPDSVVYGLDTFYVTSIGNAFHFCNNLSSLSIPRFVTSIDEYALVGCSNLTSIQVNTINPRYSSNNGVLFSKNQDTILICPQGISGSYTIPNSVTTIGVKAFYSCTNLTLVTIPNSVITIGASAFIGCTALDSIFIPSSVTSINQFAPFAYCQNLISINVDPSNIRYSSYNGVLFSKNFDTIITYPGGKSGNYSIPNSVSNIGDFAFSYCKNIGSIKLPNSIFSIGYGAFSDCDSLESITIPDSVTIIGGYAFYACNGLTSLIFKSLNPPTISSTTFDSVPNNIPFYVPCVSKSKYQSENYWKDFSNFIGYNSIIYYDTICKGLEYNNYGFNFIADTTGLYTQSLQTIDGCDSVINLNLVVISPSVPVNVIANLMQDYIELVWEGNAVEYDIYRNDSLIANTSLSNYIDSNLIDSVEYCYKVKARIDECESEFSESTCKTFVGLQDIKSDTETSVYPNPTTSRINLNINQNILGSAYTITNTIGEVILSGNLNISNMSIDLSKLPKGLYFMNIEKTHQSIKIIKQ